MEIAIVLSLLLLAVILFSLEKISVDIVTCILLVVLVLSGILTTKEAFAGFSSDFMLILAAIFVITTAIQENGVLDAAANYMLKMAKSNPNRILLYLITLTGSISAFMNNTTATALMINPVISISRKSGFSPSKFLMPVAFASIIGGTCTLIGTSTNVAVSAYLKNLDMEPISMFEFSGVGVVLLVVTILYMITIGRRLLPSSQLQDLQEDYQLRDYLSELVIMKDSPLVGQPVSKSTLAQSGFTVLGIVRGKEKFHPGNFATLEKGDVLLVEGKAENLIKIKNTIGLELLPDARDFYQKGSDLRLLEVLIPPRSEFVGAQIKETGMRQKYGIVPIAIHRAGENLFEQIEDIKLEIGDLLLVQGSGQRMNGFAGDHNLITLVEHKTNVKKQRRGFLTLGFFLAAIVVGSFELMPLSIAFLIAAILTILFKGINLQKAYENIDWRLLILIAGMSAFGTAMTKTGADKFLAEGIVSIFDNLGTLGILGGFMVLTVLLTQPMSNAAAALVVLPVALETAHALGANPRTFAITVMLAASISLITPFEPSCILVYGPGKYKFADFIKVGGILTVILMAILLVLIPIFWPLEA